MKIYDLVAGIMVLFFAAVLFVDAVRTTYDPASQILSTNDVKGITGFALIVIAIFYFIKARQRN
jgi:hypothetical protein